MMSNPAPHLAGVKLSRFPMETNFVPRLFGGSSINSLLNPVHDGFASELDLRILWPRMVPLDTPLDLETTAFSTALCLAHYEENRGSSKVGTSWDFPYDWAAAYWSSPTQHFSLPPELVELLP